MKSGVDYIGVGCGAVVINDNQEVLLVRRSMNSRTEPDTWSRPGGEVEFGETIGQAVERAVLKETGAIVKAEGPLELTQMISDGKHWIAHGYLAKYISGQPTNKEPDKHDEVRWFPLECLPENLNKYTKDSLRVYLQSRS